MPRPFEWHIPRLTSCFGKSHSRWKSGASFGDCGPARSQLLAFNLGQSVSLSPLFLLSCHHAVFLTYVCHLSVSLRTLLYAEACVALNCTNLSAGRLLKLCWVYPVHIQSKAPEFELSANQTFEFLQFKHSNSCSSKTWSFAGCMAALAASDCRHHVHEALGADSESSAR